MRNSFIFYRSFDKALTGLSDEDELAILRAIRRYSLDFEEIELVGIQRNLFDLIKPQLEANIRKYENGCKTKAKWKQSLSKEEANVNDNDNDNVNDNDPVVRAILEK